MDRKQFEKLMEKDNEATKFFVKFAFCESLCQIRQQKNLSQKQVADILKIAVSTYANWEQGRREPGIYDIIKILYFLEVSADDLFNLHITEE